MTLQSARDEAPHASNADGEDYDKQIFMYTNQARENPKSLIVELEKLLPLFVDDQLMKVAENVHIRTVEGPAAVKEAIDFLSKQPPVRTLTWSPEVARACQDHARDLNAHARMGHEGSNGSTVGDRIKKYFDYSSVSSLFQLKSYACTVD